MAMRLSNIRMTTTVEREKLLQTVRDNYARHKQIVIEARAGYIKAARNELLRLSAKLEAGEAVSITSRLRVPADHSEVYLNSISMLEWNTAEQVELEADEFRQLVRDEWEFSDDFLAVNSAYSAVARNEMASKARAARGE